MPKNPEFVVLLGSETGERAFFTGGQIDAASVMGLIQHGHTIPGSFGEDATEWYATLLSPQFVVAVCDMRKAV